MKVFLGITLPTIACMIGIMVYMIIYPSMHKEEQLQNAHEWARIMGLKDYKLYCEPNNSCHCSIRYMDDSKLDHVIGLGCCNQGCTVTSGR